MAKGSVHISGFSDTLPDWYWSRGLHDSCIVGVETFEFPFEYNKFVEEKDKYNRNLMVLKINAEGAMFDNTVSQIRLFNYKILTNHISLEGREKLWWLADRLADHGSYYTLEIDLQCFDPAPVEFTLIIKFERAEVDR